MHEQHEQQESRGKVYLIGAGPGTADLMTVKGLRHLRQADVVLYDRLIDPALLQESRPDAELIFVGKGPNCHTIGQSEINTLLIQYAQQGKIVARLKGGDPFVFGRGGEEALALTQAGIPFEIVPGVTSAIAVPAYAGIPVTHRGKASAFTVVTGHKGQSEEAQEINWEALAQLGGTLVVLMGVTALPDFTQRLVAGGLAPETPAAVIQQGTTEQQRMVTGTLNNIAARAIQAGLRAPATTIIGDVVTLQEQLQWRGEHFGVEAPALLRT
ncbi:MAG TPA: uroporphyrinogen-III C-methyltransferase [Ktedonobacteraceae bacterium]|jgi:uroporphyrin-III C-methyltransferase|nr:uroporphyrinogen-III C-methyltransferase [Ktedonobacteraceae bacterium]